MKHTVWCWIHLYMWRKPSLCVHLKCRFVFPKEWKRHIGVYKNIICTVESKPTIQKKQQPTKSTCKDTSKVDNRKPRAQNTPCETTLCLGSTLVNQGDFTDWELSWGKVHSQDKSSLTFIHVSGEAGQDTTQRCCIKKVHGAEEEPGEQLVVEHGGSLNRTLSTQTTVVVEHETWHENKQF